MTATLPRREVLALVAGWLALVLWWSSAAQYGIDLSDEGYIVYPSVQVAQGLVPYRDINSLYTPLSWYLQAGLFKLVGVDLVPLRWLFAGVSGLLVAAVYLLVRREASWPWALVGAAAYVLVLPLPQIWTPYPAWYALLGLLGAALAVGRWLHDRRHRYLYLAGLGCALAFGTKPSLGLFGLLGIGGFFVLQARGVFGPLDRQAGTAGSTGLPPIPGSGALGVSAGRRLARWTVPAVQALFVVAVGVAFYGLMGSVTNAGTLLALVGTIVLAGLALVERPAHDDLATLARGVLAVGVRIGIAFLAATLLWYVPISLAAGWEVTFDSVFRAGARTAQAFNQPLQPPSPDAVEVIAEALLAAGLVAGLAVSARRRWLTRQRLVWGAGAVLAGTVLFVAARGFASGLGPIGYALGNVAARWGRPASEETDLLVYLPFVAAWLTSGVLLVRRWRFGRTAEVADLRMGLLLWLAPLVLAQVYPHASYRHVQFSIGPFIALIALLQARLWRWAAARLPRGVAWKVAAAALLLLFPAVYVPSSLRSRAQATALSATLVEPGGGTLLVAREDADRIAFVRQAFSRLSAGAPVFAYPAMPMVYLLTGHPNPTRESYLPPGYVDASRQRDVITALEATRTRYVAWDEGLVAQWGLTPADVVLADYLRSAYRAVDRQGSWVLLERP